MSLSADELAMFSKYTDSYYLRRLGTKVPMYDKTTGRPVEKDGRPVFETESNGSPKVYSEKLFHKFKDKTLIELKNGKKILVDVSTAIIDNQLYRCSRLKDTLQIRKMKNND